MISLRSSRHGSNVVGAMLMMLTLSACSTSQQTYTEGEDMRSIEGHIGARNKSTARAFFTLLEAEKIDQMIALFAHDGRQINPYASGLFPQGADGRDALLAYWSPVPDNFDSMRFDIHEILSTEDPSVVFVRYTGALTYDGGSKLYRNDYFSVFRFNDAGEITEHVEIFNPIVAARAFGLELDPVSRAHGEVSRTITSFFGAVDARRWADVSTSMTSPVLLDYSSFGAGDASELEPGQVVDAWRGLLPGFDVTHHQLGNIEIEVTGERAVATCYVTALHTLAEDEWTVVGSYELELKEGESGWQISTLRFLFKSQSGDEALPKRAAERAANQ